MKNPTVALIQQSCTADTSANIQKSAAAIRRAAEQGADLIVLPELHTGLYFCQTEDVHAFERAESIPGPSTRIFGALAEGGSVQMPLGETFWAEAFGMVTDRFGTPWGINGGPKAMS